MSIDDGDYWQPLRLNMPRRRSRDLVVKDADLVVGARPRLLDFDDIMPLRQITADIARAGYLFRLRRRSASAGTRTPTRRCRRRPAALNPLTASSSVTCSARRRPGRSSSIIETLSGEIARRYQ
jgi:hypothetical protein